MPHLLETVRMRLARRAAYIRTVHEIRSMPLDVALDLGIFREDAEKIAANTVYGPRNTQNGRDAA